MKLPIIQSIMFGALHPTIYIVTKEIDGQESIELCSLSEVWEKCKALKVIPSYNCGFDEYGNPKYRMLETPSDEEEMDYLALANTFSKPPSSLHELESFCIRHLSSYVSFDFESERPCNISTIAPFVYTPITENYFPVNFPFTETPIPQFPIYKFYANIIKVEMARIKLALLDYSQKVQSDILTKNEVNDTLQLIRQYALNVFTKPDDVVLFSFDEMQEVCETDVAHKRFDYSIFPFLFEYLIKTYFEIEILFQPILKRNIEQDFDDVFYKCMKHYPPVLSKIRLQSTILEQKVQDLIALNDRNGLVFYHPDFVRIFPAVSDNQTFLEVFKAVENAIYLNDNTNINQLTNEKWCRDKFNEKKRAYYQMFLPLSNSREILPIIEEELGQLIKFADESITIQSIPRLMHKWLSEQYALYKQNIGNLLIPVSQDVQITQPAKATRTKRTLNNNMKIVEQHLHYLTGVNDHNETIMSPENYIQTISYIRSFLTFGQVPTITTQMQPKTTAVFLRYSFYLIYKELHLKTPSRDAWIELLHALFVQFKDTVPSTTRKKFSTKPDLYDTDIKRISRTIQD